MSRSLFLFHSIVHLCHILDSTCQVVSHGICFSLSDLLHSMIVSRSIHISAGPVSSLFVAEYYLIVYVYHIFIHYLLVDIYVVSVSWLLQIMLL